MKDNFTQIPNAIISDESISSGAFRVYSYIASKPTGWNVFNKDIQKQLQIKRPETLSKYFKELLDSGYMKREKATSTNKYSESHINGSFVYVLLSKKNPTLLKNRNNGKTVITEKPTLLKNRNHSNTNSISNTKPIIKESTKRLSAYESVINYLKENAPIKSKVTITKEGKKLFSDIEDKKQFALDYISYQEDKKEFSSRLTDYMKDYSFHKGNSVAVNADDAYKGWA